MAKDDDKTMSERIMGRNAYLREAVEDTCEGKVRDNIHTQLDSENAIMKAKAAQATAKAVRNEIRAERQTRRMIRDEVAGYSEWYNSLSDEDKAEEEKPTAYRKRLLKKYNLD